IKAERKRIILERAWPKDTAWMFTTGNGTPFGERNLLRVFDRMLDLTAKAWKKANPTDDVPSWDGLTLYSMRHTFAVTHILDEGEGVAKWLQQQMGHSSISTTLDVYADWFRIVSSRRSDHANRAARRLLGDKVGDKVG